MKRGNKPSDRHKTVVDQPELNLNSMMDLFAVLIPALLMMSAVVEVSILNVAAPSINSAESPPQHPPDKPPLNLTVSISHHGYTVLGSGGVLKGSSTQPSPRAANEGPSISAVQKVVSCSRYRDTWPPPRVQNAKEPRCTNPSESHNYWVYDNVALAKKIIEIKDAFPEERRIIIEALPDVEYEAIIDVMDATRDVREANGDIRVLFDEVILSPGQA